LDIGSDLRLPHIPVGQQFFLVIKQLFVRFGAVLEVRALNDGVNWTSFLAQTTENTLGHVDIVSGGSSRTVGSFFGFDGDGLGWARGFAEFASDASFFAGGVSPQRMFSPEPWRQRTLFEWVIDGGWLAKVLSEGHYQTSH
jgi:hypothetical protein